MHFTFKLSETVIFHCCYVAYSSIPVSLHYFPPLQLPCTVVPPVLEPTVLTEHLWKTLGEFY